MSISNATVAGTYDTMQPQYVSAYEDDSIRATTYILLATLATIVVAYIAYYYPQIAEMDVVAHIINEKETMMILGTLMGTGFIWFLTFIVITVTGFTGTKEGATMSMTAILVGTFIGAFIQVGHILLFV